MSHIETLVLAAGQSTRFGSVCKVTQLVDGTPMVRRIVMAALQSQASRVTLVTGHYASEVRSVTSDLPIQWVHNVAPQSGLASSLRVGLSAIGPGASGAVICLGDMPHVRALHIDALCTAFDGSGGKFICAPEYHGKRGNPILWPARWFSSLCSLQGDTGGRQLLASHATEVQRVIVSAPGVTVDIDSSEDLMALRHGNALRTPPSVHGGGLGGVKPGLTG